MGYGIEVTVIPIDAVSIATSVFEKGYGAKEERLRDRNLVSAGLLFCS